MAGQSKMAAQFFSRDLLDLFYAQHALTTTEKENWSVKLQLDGVNLPARPGEGSHFNNVDWRLKPREMREIYDFSLTKEL